MGGRARGGIFYAERGELDEGTIEDRPATRGKNEQPVIRQLVKVDGPVDEFDLIRTKPLCQTMLQGACDTRHEPGFAGSGQAHDGDGSLTPFESSEHPTELSGAVRIGRGGGLWGGQGCSRVWVNRKETSTSRGACQSPSRRGVGRSGSSAADNLDLAAISLDMPGPGRCDACSNHVRRSRLFGWAVGPRAWIRPDRRSSLRPFALPFECTLRVECGAEAIPCRHRKGPMGNRNPGPPVMQHRRRVAAGNGVLHEPWFPSAFCTRIPLSL